MWMREWQTGVPNYGEAWSKTGTSSGICKESGGKMGKQLLRWKVEAEGSIEGGESGERCLLHHG